MRRKIYLKILVGIVIVLLLFSMNAVSVIESNIDVIKEKVDISEENQPAVVYLHRIDPDTKRLVKEPVARLTLDEVDRLEEELKNISQNYKTSGEQIRQQLELLYKWGFIPEETYNYIQNILSFLRNISKYIGRIFHLINNSFKPAVTICGPVITSFVSIGGSILPIHDLLFHNILKPIWRVNLSDIKLPFLNGTHIQPFLGLMPAVIFLSLSTTWINIVGFKIGASTPVISPFFAMLSPHLGFGISISILENSYPLNILDISIGVSGLGVVAYFYS